MKTNHSLDSNQTYDALNVVFVRTPGFKLWLKRLFTWCKFDDVHICLKWNGDIHLCQVVQGRLQYGPTRQTWGGLMVSRGLECHVVNFPAKLGTEAKARSYVGQRFSSTARCISHIFCLSDSYKATIKSLYHAHSLLA